MNKLLILNRRDRFRFEMADQVWIRSDEGHFEKALLLDISEKGASVRWKSENRPREIHLILKFKSGSYITVKARAAWVNQGRVGLEFKQEMPKLSHYVRLAKNRYLASSITRRRCTVERALLRRERTVPMGTSRMAAIS